VNLQDMQNFDYDLEETDIINEQQEDFDEEKENYIN
jgi:hypothetical protein